MRMRKLGRGQSVMFCGPIEIERKILQHCGKMNSDKIEIVDVLRWSIAETCSNMRKSIPLWAVQGLRCQRRDVAWSSLLCKGSDQEHIDAATTLLEAEGQSLQDRYGSNDRTPEENVLLHEIEEDILSTQQGQVDAIRSKCRDFRLKSFQTSTLHEEQERELSPENEQEREVEQAPEITPMAHILHPDVENFARTGIVDRGSPVFCPAFDLFTRTSAEPHLERGKWPATVLTTTDFTKTVHILGDQPLDAFLRPVHWIARAAKGKSNELILLSPYEANELLPSIRRHGNITLHTYSARVNLTVRALDDLLFCVIPELQNDWEPPREVMLLNLFAGQLYLSDYEAYLSICEFLGLCTHPPPDDMAIASDGFLSPHNRSKITAAMVGGSCFQTSPVPFLRMLMTLRRKGQIFRNSHVGKILRGDLLGRNDF